VAGRGPASPLVGGMWWPVRVPADGSFGSFCDEKGIVDFPSLILHELGHTFGLQPLKAEAPGLLR